MCRSPCALPAPCPAAAAAWHGLLRPSGVSLARSSDSGRGAAEVQPLQRLQLVGSCLPVARVPGIGIYYNELLLGEYAHKHGHTTVSVSANCCRCRCTSGVEGAWSALHMGGCNKGWSGRGGVAAACVQASLARQPCDARASPPATGVPPVLERFMSLVPALHEVVIFLTGQHAAAWQHAAARRRRAAAEAKPCACSSA